MVRRIQFYSLLILQNQCLGYIMVISRLTIKCIFYTGQSAIDHLKIDNKNYELNKCCQPYDGILSVFMRIHSMDGSCHAGLLVLQVSFILDMCPSACFLFSCLLFIKLLNSGHIRELLSSTKNHVPECARTLELYVQS